LLGARPISPILTLKSETVLKKYSFKFLLYKKLTNQLLLFYKDKKVANCYFKPEHIEYDDRGRVFNFKLELRDKKCIYVYPFHKDKIVPYDEGYLIIKRAAKLDTYRFIYVVLEGTRAVKGKVSIFNNKALKKERDLFFK